MKTVVVIRKQLEKLIKEELTAELVTVNAIHEELANLTSRFDKSVERNDRDKSTT